MLKDQITSALILALPDNSRPYRVKADSSDFATGAVLSQQNLEDEKWHPVAFLSKSLSPVEWNYEIHDKEMLAIVQALEEWRHFLEGTEHQFEIWADHKNLEYFMSAKKLNWRQARWLLLLARFDFLLHHRPGKTMGKLDALSQRSCKGILLYLTLGMLSLYSLYTSPMYCVYAAYPILHFSSLYHLSSRPSHLDLHLSFIFLLSCTPYALSPL